MGAQVVHESFSSIARSAQSDPIIALHPVTSNPHVYPTPPVHSGPCSLRHHCLCPGTVPGLRQQAWSGCVHVVYLQFEWEGVDILTDEPQGYVTYGPLEALEYLE